VSFRLVKTGKTYADPGGKVPVAESDGVRQGEPKVSRPQTTVSPVIWETGNINQIRSLLVVREAELVAARTQLTGNRYLDWHTHNRILDLEIKIADLRKWLAEAMREGK
jgi:hypothetical protein